jgi:FdhE protein
MSGAAGAPKGLVKGRVGDVAPGAPAGHRAVLAPDPATMFARRAARLEVLAVAHPLGEWLRFLARLARAQDRAVAALPPPDLPRLAGHPPLDPSAGLADAGWRAVLSRLIADQDTDGLPEATLAVRARLAAMAPAGLAALAREVLARSVDAGQAGEAVYVAAALQVHFARLAAALPPGATTLLPVRGACPACGSAPGAGIITATGPTPGLRYLHCGLCGTAWNHVRAVCITCGESKSLAQHAVEGGNGAVKAETCDACGSFAKMLYQEQDPQVDPVADDLASLGLDIMVSDAGWSRHVANLLLPVA